MDTSEVARLRAELAEVIALLKDMTLTTVFPNHEVVAFLKRHAQTQPTDCPASPKLIGYISELVLQDLLYGKHISANICAAVPNRRNPNPGPDLHWVVPIYTLPPATQQEG